MTYSKRRINGHRRRVVHVVLVRQPVRSASLRNIVASAEGHVLLHPQHSPNTGHSNHFEIRGGRRGSPMVQHQQGCDHRRHVHVEPRHAHVYRRHRRLHVAGTLHRSRFPWRVRRSSPVVFSIDENLLVR